MKDKIIEAAGEIFAQKGYQNTTIRDICQKAGIYQLSVNYHFGSKENLFREVLLKTYQDTEEISLMEEIKDLPPDRQLEKVIRIRVMSIFSSGKQGKYFKIIAKEISNNYDLVVEIMSETVIGYLEFLKGIFNQLSSGKLGDFELNYCVYQLMSHVSALSAHEKAVQVLFKTNTPSEEQLEAFIQHVKKFTIAGVERLALEKAENHE